MRSGDHFIELTCLFKYCPLTNIIISGHGRRSIFQEGVSFLIAFVES